MEESPWHGDTGAQRPQIAGMLGQGGAEGPKPWDPAPASDPKTAPGFKEGFRREAGKTMVFPNRAVLRKPW